MSAAAPSLASRIEQFARRTVPFVISAALLTYVFRRIDIRIALDHLTADVVLRFMAPLALFSIVTLLIEAQCLHRVIGANPNDARPLSRFTAARIKAACYLLGVLNYAIGAAGLSVLVRRRTGASIAVAVGMVFLVSLFDIGSVLAWVALGGVWLQTETYGLRIGLVGLMIAAIAAGFVFLRLPIALGPLDSIRDLPLFRAARDAKLTLLFEIGVLRLLFVGCFVLLVRGLFWSFEVDASWGELAFKVGIMLVVSALPIAAGGLGTGQIVFVELFSGAASEPRLLAMSVVFSMAMIVSRALIGLLFASEFAREALAATREEQREELARASAAGESAAEEAPEEPSSDV